MNDFPTNIFHMRETENLPGIVYNPADKKNLFSEDIQNLGNEITLIETALIDGAFIFDRLVFIDDEICFFNDSVVYL